jgi:hypothetical protein
MACCHAHGHERLALGDHIARGERLDREAVPVPHGDPLLGGDPPADEDFNTQD